MFSLGTRFPDQRTSRLLAPWSRSRLELPVRLQAFNFSEHSIRWRRRQLPCQPSRASVRQCVSGSHSRGRGGRQLSGTSSTPHRLDGESLVTHKAKLARVAGFSFFIALDGGPFCISTQTSIRHVLDTSARQYRFAVSFVARISLL
jgi:hypothetical protein